MPELVAQGKKGWVEETRETQQRKINNVKNEWSVIRRARQGFWLDEVGRDEAARAFAFLASCVFFSFFRLFPCGPLLRFDFMLSRCQV